MEEFKGYDKENPFKDEKLFSSYTSGLSLMPDKTLMRSIKKYYKEPIIYGF